jgi:hypothetical protein
MLSSPLLSSSKQRRQSIANIAHNSSSLVPQSSLPLLFNPPHNLIKEKEFEAVEEAGEDERKEINQVCNRIYFYIDFTF